ncbi:hypothetical protein BSLG_007651 [Batrachochytrium salamandrivorans]|nr:hypothetical protein BSLG_007651 [Batrachochytrium salamandrivorans]
MGPEPAISEVEFKTSLKPKKSADIAVDSAADGVTWGFAEDAYEGDEFAGQDIDMSSIDRSTIDPNAFYYSDPRKALRVWKRSAETDAALEACAKLDKHGLLSCSGAETTQKIKNRMKELYGDDNDEDSFYDRTSKVNQLKSKLALQNENPETLESLELKRTHTLGEIERLQKVISKADKDAIQAVEEIDELDQFMSQVNSSIQSESITANRKSLNEFEAEVPKTMVSICSFINELATTKASAEISSDEAVPPRLFRPLH